MSTQTFPESYSLFDQLAEPKSTPAPQKTQQYPDSYSLFDKLAQPPKKESKPTKVPNKLVTEQELPEQSQAKPLAGDLKKSKPVTVERRQQDLIGSFNEGLKRSASGELRKQFFGDAKELEERVKSDPSFWEELIQEAGTIGGDLPFMAAGATLGAAAGGVIGSVIPGAGTAIGATVGGAFGAMAVPAFLKEAITQYRDFQEKGGDLTFGEFLQRADKVANRTLNEGLFGTILGAINKAAPLLEKTPGIGKLFTTKLAKTAGVVGAEAGAATTVPALAEGRLPESRDFARALALFGGLKLAQLPSSVREDIQKKGQASGKTPEEFAKTFPKDQLEEFKTQVEPQEVAETELQARAPKEQKAEIPKAPIAEEVKPFEEIETPSEGRTLDQAVSFEPVKEPKKESKGATFRTAVVDELYPLQRYVEGTGVANLPITEDPYKMARLFKGWSGKAETFLEYKPFDPDTLDFKYKGFREIIKPYKEELPELSKYLVAKRAIELRKQGKETGIDLRDAHRFIKENAKYEKPAREVKAYQSALLDYARKSGLITPETQGLWEQLNADYVPFQRVIDAPEEYFGKSMQPKKTFFELKGSKKPIVDPLESIIGNTYSIIRASEQNRVLKSLVDFDRKHRKAGEFIDLSDGKTEEPNLKSFFDYLSGKDTIRDDSIKYIDNGKFKIYKVPKEIAETLKGLKSEQIPFWGKLFSYPTRAIRTGAITLSPGTLLKLAIVDQLEAFLYTDVGYVPYVDLAKGFFNAIKKGDLYYKWKASGGDQSLAREMSRNFKRNKLAKVAKKVDLSESKSMDGALRAFESLSRPLEEATRISVFEKTMKRKGMSPDALREAALNAREATLDFAKKGAQTKFLTQAIPFFNSAIQGADKFFQEVKRNPKKVIPKAIASVTLPTLALYMANKDRKEYQELPSWEKDKYWHFYVPFGDQTLHLKMAKPYELGAFFGNLPERLAAWAYTQDKDNLKAIVPALWQTFTPGFVPAAIQPMIESFANEKIFSGVPIIPKRLENLPREEQFTPYTTETAKVLGRLFSKIPYIGTGKVASPVIIDEWLDSYSAGVGKHLVQFVESTLRKTGVIPEKVDPEKEISDYPILKSFFGKKGYSSQAASIRRFYDESDKLIKQEAALKRAKKEGREKDALRYSKDYIPGKVAQARRIRKVFAKNHQTIRNILVDTENYTPSEKKILIDQLVNDMVGISRSYLGKDQE